MAYTTIDKSGEHFNTVLYTGNNGAQTVTGVGFQPDWVWIKDRDGTERHCLTDSVRGVLKELRSNEAAAESDRSAGDSGVAGVSAFNSDGFVLVHDDGYNDNNSLQVSWNWKAGTSFTNDASSTSVGSIDSAGSVSTDARFSIISWTGTGANATVAHGLGSVPKTIILKNRDSAENWIVGHNSNGWGKYQTLNTNDATSTASNIWQDTAPSSSIFTIGASGKVNGSSHKMIAYCFAEVKGYSKFGSYVGNGNADGPFVYLGFRPAFVLWKRTQDSGYDWDIYDTARDTHNVAFKELLANGNGAESDGTVLSLDILSNGFKLRTNNNNGNASGKTYIYMAFAENPFVNSKGIPNNAR